MSNEYKIEVDKLKGKKVFVAIPSYDRKLYTDTCIGLLNLTYYFSGLGIDVEVYFVNGESLVNRARNICVRKFLDSDAEFLMFIDSDIGFDKKHVLYLLQQMVENKEISVIGGACPKKEIDWEAVFQIARGDNASPKMLPYVGGKIVYNVSKPVEVDDMRPVEVDYVGTGFMMIRRETIEKYIENRPKIEYMSDHVEIQGKMWNVFHSDIVEGRYLSEDYYFCRNVKEDGGKIFLAPLVNLVHIGNYQYRGLLKFEENQSEVETNEAEC